MLFSMFCWHQNKCCVLVKALYNKLELLFSSQHNLENNVMGHPVLQQVRASQVKHLDEKIEAHPDDSDLLIEREFVDEICEAHAKPGEAAYDSSHDMALTGDQEMNQTAPISLTTSL